MSSNNKLSTEGYKGVRDFYPEDMAILKHIFAVWRKTAESFGYQEYNASILEPTELYHAKSGEEIVNEQTYTFTDRGDRSVTLRPEMTPTVARMIAARRRDLSMPVRWYSIPNVFRYEKPQRGRLREHFQLNCDLFGLSSIDADIEIIALASSIMKNLGAKNEDFEIRISSRILLKKAFDDAGLDETQALAMQKLLDKKDKLAGETFTVEAERILGRKIEDKELFLAIATEGTDIQAILEALALRGVTNVKFDASIVRGFDYYTGIVFEIYDTDPENRRAIFGGGRYDGLTSLFDGQSNDEKPLPAVGFGMGDVTARDFLETHGLIPAYVNPALLSIAIAETDDQADNESIKAYVGSVADKVRSHDINVVVDYSGKKIGDQIKKASKDGVAFITVIGADEASTGTLKVKNLATSDETIVDGANELALFLKDYLMRAALEHKFKI